MRLVLSALMMFLTLRLSVVGADVSCVKHDMASNGGAAMDMGDQHHAAANGATKDKDTHGSPVTLECCRALASCSADLIGQAAVCGGLVPARVDRPNDDIAALRSRLVAPDTPPPKA